MAKELDLIMQPKKAPAELTAAVTAHQTNYDALIKAQTAMSKAKADLSVAQSKFDKTEVAYQEQLKKWEVK